MMSHPNQQWFVLDLLTGMDSQRHHQIGRISGINGIGSDDLSGEPHLIFNHSVGKLALTWDSSRWRGWRASTSYDAATASVRSCPGPKSNCSDTEH